ncbi:hypothetical protein GWI33_017700 [Rhynchophorus ferrugineus]|uniref:Uncharacterized protein n=1 Tax=Rhynchophorus ferrugineus TaxID=354439 RepID=A0A834HW86_RHYFE|nr:hypothetical protein GWI33_017700 [Rhynchophorus ferrugineus]
MPKLREAPARLYNQIYNLDLLLLWGTAPILYCNMHTKRQNRGQRNHTALRTHEFSNVHYTAPYKTPAAKITTSTQRLQEAGVDFPVSFVPCF